MSLQEALTKSALARIIEKANSPWNNALLSTERTVVESNVVHHDHVGRNGELTVIHDTIGDDDTDVPDEIRFERKVIEYEHKHFSVNRDSTPLTINIPDTINAESVAAALNKQHGFKLRTVDVKPITTAGKQVVSFTADCLLYSGSVSVLILKTA